MFTDADVFYDAPGFSRTIQQDFIMVEKKMPKTEEKKKEEKKETVRKFFPETWIWDLVPVG